MSHAAKIRRDDEVIVISGKDRGKTGTVLRVDPKKQRVYVEGLNIVKRHTKPRPIRNTSRMGAAGMTPGGVIEKPAPIPAGSVMVVCPTCKLPTRVGYRFKDDKGGHTKVRVCKRPGCGQEIDR